MAIFGPQASHLNCLIHVFLYFKSVALIAFYVEQDVNFTWPLFSGLEN